MVIVVRNNLVLLYRNKTIKQLLSTCLNSEKYDKNKQSQKSHDQIAHWVPVRCLKSQNKQNC